MCGGHKVTIMQRINYIRYIFLLVSDLDGALPKSTSQVRPEKGIFNSGKSTNHRAADAVAFADLIALYDATRQLVL